MRPSGAFSGRSKRHRRFKEGAVLKAAASQVEEYLAGERVVFDLPLEPVGTEFQRKVWRELARIPYGKTISYTDLARRIRNDKAVRAVGSANGRNPLSLVIPCHRVIAADGSLGGYAGGLEIKKRLLELERAAAKRPR
jgi:methylated-DNA-[protein]-cysteine S-methyltransferase